eukprot:2236429-Prorocentrum_lima.AAC.1
MSFHLGPGGKFTQLSYLWVLHKNMPSMVELMKRNLTGQVAQWNRDISGLVPCIRCNDPAEC